MAVKLPSPHRPQLLSWLEQYLPRSFQVHGQLKHHLRGQCPDVEFFVDCWPRSQGVVARIGHLEQDSLVGVFAVSEEKLTDLLQDPGVVPWSRPVLLPGVSMDLHPVVQTVAEDRGHRVTVLPITLLKASPQHLKPFPVPEGMKIRPVSSADSHFISSKGRFTFQGSEAYVRQCVQHLPSVYLGTETGHHVGHMLGISWGVLGFLYVNPEFRQNGYAKAIISQLAQKYFERGEDVRVVVEESNEVSLALHKSLGFTRVSESRLVCLSCEPKNVKGNDL